jgi:hypothetical protein
MAQEVLEGGDARQRAGHLLARRAAATGRARKAPQRLGPGQLVQRAERIEVPQRAEQATAEHFVETERFGEALRPAFCLAERAEQGGEIRAQGLAQLAQAPLQARHTLRRIELSL